MRTATAAAIGVILVASYFGGRRSNTGVLEYEYAEVYDVVGRCPAGTFTGECSDCRKCLGYEYNAGGCSYFKDTLCVLCEDIPHCGQAENAAGKLVPAISCTDGFDERCSVCEPGYWDEDCKPCKVCGVNFYETQKCTQSSNTVCAACTTCAADPEGEEFLSTACTYFSDSVCTPCTICSPGTFSEVVCELPDGVYTTTADTVCTSCTEPEAGFFVIETCTITKDTKLAQCSECEPRVEYIDEDCAAGAWHTEGEDIDCESCTPRPNSKYTIWHCDSQGYKDSLHVDCSDCSQGEYSYADCTESADTLCPDCTAIEHCKDGELYCTDASDSKCFDCTEGFYGDTCSYEKTFSACGTITTRERRASQFGYDGNSNEEFIQFCLDICDEFPDCMAFEVEDGGDSFYESGDNSLSDRGATCHFKSAYSRLNFQYEKDCYSNIVRQGDNFRDPGGYDQQTEWMLWYQAEVLQFRHGWGHYAAGKHPREPPEPPPCDPTPMCEMGIVVNMDRHGCGGLCVVPDGLKVTEDGYIETDDKFFEDKVYHVGSNFGMWNDAHEFIGIWDRIRDSPIVYDLHSAGGQDYMVDKLGHAWNTKGDQVGAWDEYLDTVVSYPA